jgi:YD repeat-containing protein
MTTSNAVHSQAFGFMSFVQGGVDERTGQYTVSISLPEVESNQLCGPAVPLNLTFNPINTIDSGFGLGWDLKLTQYTPHNSILALSTGETYKVTGSGPTPDIKEKKLDNFHFEDNLDGTYRVVHKSGLIEILTTGGSSDNRVALPTRIYSPAGHSVSLTYASFMGGQRLESIADAQGDLLRINRRADNTLVEILVRPYDGPGGTPLARYEMKLNSNRWVTEIVLPTAEKASWRFGYGNGPIRGILCLHEIKTPAGGRETLEYNDEGHAYPGGVTRPNLPRVTRHHTYPGFEQPMVEVSYQYTAKNFLGAGASVTWEEGMDPLYKVDATYEYGTTTTLVDRIGRSVRKAEYTFNRFHLLIEQKTAQDHCVQRVATRYYADNRPFEQQVPQFQMPLEATTSWEMDNDATRYRAQVTRTAFDTHGNQTEQVEPTGIQTLSTYYPKEGGDGCPADPEGFVRHLKDTTVIPAPGGPNEAPAPTLRTRMRYEALKPLAGSGLKDWLVNHSETLLHVEGTSETELQQTLRSYNELPNNVFLHGRVLSQRVTLNGNTSVAEYAYQVLDSVLAGGTVLETTETFKGFDYVEGAESEVKKVIVTEDSLLHGKPLLTRDDSGEQTVKIRYTYDALLRVLTETVSPDNPEFMATRSYEYWLTSRDEQQASQIVTDVKGVKTRTLVDGLNRPVYEERQNADSSVRADIYRPTYSAQFDVLGNLIESTEEDWDGEGQVRLTSRFEFDAWGMQRCMTGPDGVRAFEQTDPIGNADWKGPIQRAWREGAGLEPMVSGRTVTYLNLFEKPVRIERFEANGSFVSVQKYLYDGLGQTVEEIDALEARTQYRYDAFGRLTTNILPGGATVRRRYAEHSSEDLPIEISVDHVVLGEQTFDGLDRMTQSITGGRLQRFSYAQGQTRAAKVITPSQQEIYYEYEFQLGEEPRQRRLPGSVTADYRFDPKNARLLGCAEQGLELTREYFSTGELKSEQRIQDGQRHSMAYDYSLKGRLLRYIDVLDQTQSFTYDEATRLIHTELGSTSSTFTYDSLGQTSTISTHDSVSGQRVTISLEYDGFGRETKRTFDLDGVEQTLTQVYNEVDQLVQRTLSEGSTLLRDETYSYDPRGRLVQYECEGSQAPVDPYGKVISSQVFRFDALDNLTRVTTLSADGGSNVAVYAYQGADPAQLTKVTNTGDGYDPEIELIYDLNGNLVRDERGRVLEYDALSRLISVSALPGETPSGYRYDPLDTLSGVDSGNGEQQRFYQGGELASLKQGGNSTSFLRGDGVVLAEHQAGADPKS